MTPVRKNYPHQPETLPEFFFMSFERNTPSEPFTDTVANIYISDSKRLAESITVLEESNELRPYFDSAFHLKELFTTQGTSEDAEAIFNSERSTLEFLVRMSEVRSPIPPRKGENLPATCAPPEF